MRVIDERRMRRLNNRPINDGPIVYWMSRDQRLRDNWALLAAADLAAERRQPVAVVFCLVDEFLGAGIRQYKFMLDGLQQLSQRCQVLNLPFYLLIGDPVERLTELIRNVKAGALITDFDPLRLKVAWKRRLAGRLPIAFWEVDAHNLVPCWLASDHQEFAARTFRPKLLKVQSDYLTEFPELRRQSISWQFTCPKINWSQITARLKIDYSVAPVPKPIAGEIAAKRALIKFIDRGLVGYGHNRNIPTIDGQSNLSAYLHFGQLSAQRVLLAIQKALPLEDRAAFVEELLVRRELADNFCFYNSHYDNWRGLPNWSRVTLQQHLSDVRPVIYSANVLEQAKTHDDLWNAAQKQMMITGKMHGYLRMYWAKKILEWSRDPRRALRLAIKLNDKYQLDGRDPNGYAGIAWSIGGLHDRPWFERPIFGKIRLMTYRGCQSKFSVAGYIARIDRLAEKTDKQRL